MARLVGWADPNIIWGVIICLVLFQFRAIEFGPGYGWSLLPGIYSIYENCLSPGWYIITVLGLIKACVLYKLIKDVLRQLHINILMSKMTLIQINQSTLTGRFTPQRDSNAENVSMSWRHHAQYSFDLGIIPEHQGQIIMRGVYYVTIQPFQITNRTPFRTSLSMRTPWRVWKLPVEFLKRNYKVIPDMVSHISKVFQYTYDNWTLFNLSGLTVKEVSADLMVMES